MTASAPHSQRGLDAPLGHFDGDDAPDALDARGHQRHEANRSRANDGDAVVGAGAALRHGADGRGERLDERAVLVA